MTLLLAVHISDGVLATPWWVVGFVLAGLCVFASAWQLRDAELPTIALLTAAFFLASSLHLRVGPSSVHLLLNGLLGIILGMRAPLGIFVGLALQAVLMQHGGLTALGVNACIMIPPALLCRGLFVLGVNIRGSAGALLVAACVAGWLLGMTACIALFLDNGLPFQSSEAQQVDWTRTTQVATHPVTWACVLLAGGIAWVWEAKQRRSARFALGLFLGALTVMLTTLLNTAVLVLGGVENWLGPALFLAMLHLPIAMLEGFIVAGVVVYLSRVKPGLLGVDSDKLA